MKARGTRPLGYACRLLGLAALLAGCSLLETRVPEEPGQSSSSFIPPTRPEIVIANLQGAIQEKNVENYAACFSDSTRADRPYGFTPSAEAIAQYPGILLNWSLDDERSYFRELIARTEPTRFSRLTLTEKSRVINADSVMYNYDYVLIFEHSDPQFPTTLRGNLQFSLGTDNSSFWSIYHWSDFKVGENDVTWSSLKGRFSN